MTNIQRTKHVIVFFDICSSSKILEDLSADGGYLNKWRTVLHELQVLMERKEEKFECDAYKFLGDGWIMVIPNEVTGATLWEIVRCISSRYAELYEEHIRDNLSAESDYFGDPGITFGVADGLVTKMELRAGEIEYVGRPVNIAARLQAGVKERDDTPQNKMLMTRKLFNRLGLREEVGEKDYKFVVRKLRNISYDYGVRCAKVSIPVRG